MRNLAFGIVLLIGTQALGFLLTNLLGFGWSIGMNVLVTVGLLKFALPERVWALALLVLALFSVPSSWIARDALPIIFGETVEASVEETAQLPATATIIHLKDGFVAVDYLGTNVAKAKRENVDIEVVTTVAPIVVEDWSKEEPVRLWAVSTRSTLGWESPHRKLVRLAPDWSAEAAAQEATERHGLQGSDEPRFYSWTDDPEAWIDDKLELLATLVFGPLVVWLIMFAMGIGRGGEPESRQPNTLP